MTSVYDCQARYACYGKASRLEAEGDAASDLGAADVLAKALAVLLAVVALALEASRGPLPTHCRPDASPRQSTAEDGPASSSSKDLDRAAQPPTIDHQAARLPRVSQTWCRWFDSRRGQHICLHMAISLAPVRPCLFRSGTIADILPEETQGHHL